jgi:hypothetical protein
MAGGVVLLKSSCHICFLHKHHTKLHADFVLWTQLVRATGFWLQLRWETHFVSPHKMSERPGMRSSHE